jgi:hypothetical protein
MSRMRLILLDVFTTFAVCAIVSASTSAHAWLLKEGKEVGAGGFEFEIYNSAENTLKSKFETRLEAVSVIIQCEENFTPLGAENKLEKEGKSIGKFEFKNCSVYYLVNKRPVPKPECIVKEPVVLKYSGKIEAVGQDALVGAGAMETFGELEVKGEKCTVKGTYKIKGKQTCAISEPEIEFVLGGLYCTAVGGVVMQGAESARLFIIDTIKLKEREMWSTN